MSAVADPGALDPQKPWPGLRSFGEADSAYFFGREAESQALQELVQRGPVVVLYGQSGLGKTSLLRAGLFPALKAAHALPVWVRLDWAADAAPLTQQVLAALMVAFQQAGIEAPAPASDDSLWSYFHRADADFWGPRNRLVTPIIVLDQFEEMFTLGRRNAAAAARAEAFVQDLEAQFEQRPPAAVREHLERHPEDAASYDLNRDNVRFVLSLREDFLPDLDAWRDRLPSMLARRYRLEPMTCSQALQVVQRAGRELVSDAVANDIVGFVASGGADPRVEPAILSVVCDELNLRRLRAGQAQITGELLSGERSRIIEDFYERSFEGISERTRDWVEDELLTASGHRDRAAIEDGRKAGVDTAELERLVERRVLHSDERNQVQWLEFTHDLLTAPALNSRTVRQQRQTESMARQREDEVRRKLRRSRAMSAVFGVMALVMALGAWKLSDALAEAERQRAEAASSLAKAKVQTQLALQEKQRADEAAALAQQRQQQAAEATRHAEAERERAIGAEAAARRNLNRAEQTALVTAEQAANRLRAQWINPGFDSANVVRTNIANVEPLVREFADVAVVRTMHQQLLALAALVHVDRGEYAACAPLAERSRKIRPDVATVAGQEALATSLLAQGSCLLLSGQFAQSEQNLQHAAAAARQLPPQSASRTRLLVLTALTRVESARLRLMRDAALNFIAEAQAELSGPGSAGLTPGEADALRLLTVIMHAGLNEVHALRLQELREADALLGRADGVLKTSPKWLARGLQVDLLRAGAWSQMGRNADADDLVRQVLARYDRLLVADPGHVERQLQRLRSLRLRAEILAGWNRKTEAPALIADMQSTVAEILKQEPKSADARYQQGVVVWLRATRSEEDAAIKRARLMESRQLLEAYVADMPDAAEAHRSIAVLDHALGRIDATESQKSSLSKEQRAALLASGEAHFKRALERLGQLHHAQNVASIADLAASVDWSLGDLLLSHDRTGDALASFMRGADAFRRVAMSDERNVNRAVDVVAMDSRIARALRLLGRWDEAAKVDAQALKTVRGWRVKAPAEFLYIDSEAWVHRMAASDYMRDGRLANAVASQMEAIKLLHQALKDNLLSKPAEDALNETFKYVDLDLRPAVRKSGNRALLARLDKMEGYRATSAFATRNADLPDLPLMPGDWEHFGSGSKALEQFGLTAEMRPLLEEGWTVTGSRRMALPFYSAASLVEVELQRDKGVPMTTSYVVQKEKPPVRLNGKATLVHELNEIQALDLSNTWQAGRYLRFFMLAMQADHGRFRVVEQASDLMWHIDADRRRHQSVERRLEPLEMSRGSDGTWTATGTLHYANALYHTKLTVARDGKVDMMNDRPFAVDLPLVTETYGKVGRVRDESMAQVGLRIDKRKQAVESRDWRGAAGAQQSVVDAYLSSANNKALPGAYLSLSWYRLLANEPDGALKAAEAGLRLEKESLPLQTNRAHALLLLGREKDAMDLYRSHIGKPVSTSNTTLWQAEILNDLRRFDEYGLKDSRFMAVRQLMEAAKP